LRGREAGDIGQLLIGQAAIILQCAQYFQVEGINRYHASNTHTVHEPCMM
jgi:hypothetical protein